MEKLYSDLNQQISYKSLLKISLIPTIPLHHMAILGALKKIETRFWFKINSSIIAWCLEILTSVSWTYDTYNPYAAGG